VLGQNYARDYRIREFNGAAFPRPGCHQAACALRGGNIEGNNSMADLIENSVECLDQRRSPLLPGMICSPNRTSRTVTEVVQMDVRGCWSNQATTFLSGVRYIKAESTLVSRMIMTQTITQTMGA
jgi:hypothetical protein